MFVLVRTSLRFVFGTFLLFDGTVIIFLTLSFVTQSHSLQIAFSDFCCLALWPVCLFVQIRSDHFLEETTQKNTLLEKPKEKWEYMYGFIEEKQQLFLASDYAEFRQGMPLHSFLPTACASGWQIIYPTSTIALLEIERDLLIFRRAL